MKKYIIPKITETTGLTVPFDDPIIPSVITAIKDNMQTRTARKNKFSDSLSVLFITLFLSKTKLYQYIYITTKQKHCQLQSLK